MGEVVGKIMINDSGQSSIRAASSRFLAALKESVPPHNKPVKS